MTKVSVIVPVYGVEKYIERCARSLFEQTLVDMEFIFIDDCTPDKSIDVLKSILEEYPHRKTQVKILPMEQNSGQAAARKRGMLAASGEYMIHCDPDDWVDLDMYGRMYNLAVHTGSDMVRCDFVRTDGNNSTPCLSIPESDYSDNAKLISHLLRGEDMSSLCDKLVKRSLVAEDFEFPKFNMQEDFVICLQYFLNGKKTTHIAQPFYHYFYNPASICGRKDDETYAYRLKSVTANRTLALSIIERRGLTEKFHDDIVAMKFHARDEVAAVAHRPRFNKLWKETFPEINDEVMHCDALPLRDKYKYLAISNLYE